MSQTPSLGASMIEYPAVSSRPCMRKIRGIRRTDTVTNIVRRTQRGVMSEGINPAQKLDSAQTMRKTWVVLGKMGRSYKAVPEPGNEAKLCFFYSMESAAGLLQNKFTQNLNSDRGRETNRNEG